MWTQGCCHTGGRPLFCRYYGAEFINGTLYDYCQAHEIQFTRGRPYKKDDNAHVEQKNWTHVRKLMGDVRYDSPAALAALIEMCVSNRQSQPRAILSGHATTGKPRGVGATATARD